MQKPILPLSMLALALALSALVPFSAPARAVETDTAEWYDIIFYAERSERKNIPAFDLLISPHEEENAGEGATLSPRSLFLYRDGKPLNAVRVMVGNVFVSRPALPGGMGGKAGNWYQVESSATGTGVNRQSFSLVSPRGLVLHLYEDADVEKTPKLVEKDGQITATWQEKRDGEPVAASAVLGLDAVRVRVDAPPDPVLWDWTKLKTAEARFVSAQPENGTMMLLTFQTKSGKKLELAGLTRPLWEWLGQHKNQPLLLTYGNCQYDRAGESGDLRDVLYDATPAPPETVPNPAE